MTSSAGTPAGPGAGGLPRRVGRPPRIDRDAIARAVTEIGLDESPSSGRRPPGSVPGLYHHVWAGTTCCAWPPTRSPASACRGPGPALGGLLRVGPLRPGGLAEQPELLQQFVGGGINDDWC